MEQYDKNYFKGLEKANITELPRNLRNLKKIEAYKNGGRLLDVGIGTGLFIKLAKNSGWEVYGIDISKYAASKLAKDKVKIVLGELKDSSFKKSFFDVINMRHTIEHTKDPKELLLKAFSLLKKGGLIYISTPNSYGFHAKVFGETWPHWSLPFHLHFFSKSSLCRLAEGTGFKILIVETEEITIYDWVKFLISRSGLGLNYQQPSNFSKILDKFLARGGFGEGLVVIAKKQE